MEKLQNLETRDRILIAAGEVFAESGFRASTVRKICRRADVNVALINYYFRNKNELYSAVLEYAYRQALEKYPRGPLETDHLPPEEKLARFVRNFLRRTLDEGRPSWHGKLMAREIVEPTGAMEQLIGREFRPLHEQLGSIVREIRGEGAEAPDIHRHVFSILGQCLFYRHSRRVIATLYPSFRLDAGEIERVATHITEFSLAALKNMDQPSSTR
jgi:AcrR family transcriptional regulator